MEEAKKEMNTPQIDYNFVLGLASAVLGLCIMLTAGHAVKVLWMQHSPHPRRPRRKQ
jgi:hypothetical protein